MLGARATRHGHLLPERFSRPEEADTGIRRREPGRLREDLHGHVLDIYRLENLGVLRFQGARQPANAGADLPVKVVVRTTGFGQALCERGQCAFFSALAAVAVDGRVPKDAVEPRHEGLVWQVGQPVHVARERVLNEVFGQRPIAKASLEESQKGPVVLNEHIGHAGALVG